MSRYQRGMRIAALATEAVLAPAFSAWIGFEVDQRMGWSPWGMLVGLLLGGVVAIKLFLILGKTDEKSSE